MQKNLKTKLCGLLAVLLLGCLFARAQLVDMSQGDSSWVSPAEQWQTLGPPQGALFISGGANSDSVYASFMEVLGDPDALIVFISTANDTLDERNKAYRELTKHGATNIVLLHTHDRREADSEAFVEPLRRAKAVYISGGYQRRLAQMYLHTLTHREIFNLLERGGIVGGSSAGASIQGSYLYNGGEGYAVGFDLLKNSVIGQHYVRRKRMGSVAKIIEEHPGLFGIGIDEATAIVVRGNTFEVVGDSKVGVYDIESEQWSNDGPQEYLFLGDRYDIANRKVVRRAKLQPQDVWDASETDWQQLADARVASEAAKGTLLLYGGEAGPESLRHFLNAAGGPEAEIVVLSSGNDKREANAKLADDLQALGASNVTLLHTIDRNEADSAAFTEPLRTAQAVWICDGSLWRYADTYLHTLVHKELFGVLGRGGAVAATGTATGILGSRLFDAGYSWQEGYALLPQAMLFDAPLKAKSEKSARRILEKDEALRGIGLSENARLVIQNGVAIVEGEGEVTFYAPAEEHEVAAKTLSAGEGFSLQPPVRPAAAAEQ